MLLTRTIAGTIFAGCMLNATITAAQTPPVMVEPGPVFWKKITAQPGEYPLSACRRVFGVAGTFDATRGYGNTVYCKVTFADLYTPGEVKQNFGGSY